MSHLAGRMAELGQAQCDQATLQALTQEVSWVMQIFPGHSMNN